MQCQNRFLAEGNVEEEYFFDICAISIHLTPAQT